MKNADKMQSMVKMLSSLGVNIKKTKSRLEIINTLPNSTQHLKSEVKCLNN